MDNLTLEDACKFKHLKKLKPATQKVMAEAKGSLQNYLNKALADEFNTSLFGVCAGLLDNGFTAEQAVEVIYAMPAHRPPKSGEIERAVGRIYNADIDGTATDSEWPQPKKVAEHEMLANIEKLGVSPCKVSEVEDRLGESPDEASNSSDFLMHYFSGLDDPCIYLGGQKIGQIQKLSTWLADSEIVDALGYDQILANPMKRVLTPEERANIPSGGRQKGLYNDTLDVVTIESDRLDSETQLGVITRLADYLPLVSIVYSGGKSYHATFSLNGLTREQVTDIRQVFVNLGADRGVLSPQHLVRLGGVKSSKIGNKLQEVLWIDPDARTRAVEAGKLAELLNGGEMDSDEKLWQFMQERQYDEMSTPEFHPPLVCLKEIGVIWRGNVHTLVAQSKAGKTHALGALMRTMATGERTLGWTVDVPEQDTIAYLDFEQDAEDFHHLLCRHAGVTSSQVKGYRFAGMDAHQAQRSAELILDRTPSLCVLIIDGYADLSRDVNSQEEAVEIVQKWMDLTAKYNVALLGVLHLNPGSETKSRGHLGSQLERKSKTVLQIDVDGEGIRETYVFRARKQPVPKGHGASWQWCDNEGGFVEITETRAEAKKLDKARKLQDELDKVTNRFDDDVTKWAHKELVEQTMSGLELKERASKNRIKSWLDSGWLVKTDDDLYKLPDPF